MAFLRDTDLDAALAAIVAASPVRVDICSQEPTTYAEATSTYTLGNTTTTAGAVANASPNGRSTTLAAITGATVSGTGTATHWAVSDGASVLYATGSLNSSQAVTASNTFDLSAIVIRVADAVDA